FFSFICLLLFSREKICAFVVWKRFVFFLSNSSFQGHVFAGDFEITGTTNEYKPTSLRFARNGPQRSSDAIRFAKLHYSRSLGRHERHVRLRRGTKPICPDVGQ